MTREDEIQARLDAATPGPWKTSDGFWVNNLVFGPMREVIADCKSAQNTNLIAHAPDDLAYLLKKNAKKDAEISRFGAAIIHTYTVNYIQGLEKENSMLVGEIVRLENLVIAAEQSDSLAQPSPNKYVETESATHANCDVDDEDYPLLNATEFKEK